MVTDSDILNASILIVDDQAANVMLLERLLREAGYSRVVSTMNSRQVCALHRENGYDLILLDLQMPGMDGFQVMEDLKASDAEDEPLVLVITAQPGHKQRALQAGAKDFISKPYDLAEVKTRIHNLLEVRLLSRKLEKYGRMLKRLDRIDNELVPAARDELDALLASLRGALAALASGAAGPQRDQAREFIEGAHGSCERLVRLINHMHDGPSDS